MGVLLKSLLILCLSTSSYTDQHWPKIIKKDEFLFFLDVSVTRKTENQDSIRVLKSVCEVISNGERFSQDIAWGKLSLLITLMLLFILFPLMSIENFQFYVAATDLNTWSGKIIFILQVLLTGFCVAAIWIVLILRRIDSKAYRNVLENVKAKIRYLEQKNHRKWHDGCG